MVLPSGKPLTRSSDISKDVTAILEEINGLENIDDGLSDADSSVRLSIDRNKAAACGLTSAQILQAITARTTTDATAITMNKDGVNLDVKLVNETEPLTYENLMDMELEVDTTNEDGELTGYTISMDDTCLDYTAQGKLSAVREKHSDVISFEWSSGSITVSDPTDREYVLSVNENGNITSITDPAEGVINYTYNNSGI